MFFKTKKNVEKNIFYYKVYAKTFGRIFLDICFYDSQKKSDTKLLKIHLEM